MDLGPLTATLSLFLLCIGYGSTSNGNTDTVFGQLAETGGDDDETYNNTILFYLYTRSAVKNPQQLWLDDMSSLKSSDFDPKKNKTFVVIHGFTDSYKSPDESTIVQGLQVFEDGNIIAVDWSYYSKNLIYTWVVAKVPDVGNYIGKFVSFLIDKGVPEENIHFIGHSLGAHVSGFAGKELKALGHTAGRITGLDPAGPAYEDTDDSSRLSSTDAQFVDCIHTCGGLLGITTSICQADYFPNGGMYEQPGCRWLDFGRCSHSRSFEFFAESMNRSHHFYAQTCNAVINGKSYGCTNDGAQMGYYASPLYLGEFYLKTHDHSPFALNITSSASANP